MSNAIWAPNKGSWGWLGTSGGSDIGKLRRFGKELPGGRLPTRLKGENWRTAEANRPIPGAPTVGQSTKQRGPFDKWYRKYREFAFDEPLRQMQDPTHYRSEFRKLTQTEKDMLQEAGKEVTTKTYMPRGVGSAEGSAALIAKERSRLGGLISDLGRQ